MIRYKEIAFIAYPVTDMARARKFYEGVLGLKPNAPVESEKPQWIEYDVGPGSIGIGSSSHWLPSPDGPSAALEVEDFDAAVATLREHSVPIIIGPLDFPSCQMATVRDPDGNKLTLHRRKAPADAASGR
jgi:predicted enzyme related to lactoylglutathione lyase